MKYIYIIATILWTGALVWVMWPLGPPIDFMDNNSVSPATVKAGGEISVTREFIVNRVAPVVVLRTLVRGDCAVTCETVDLASSVVTLAEGERRVQTRSFTLPSSVDAGEWNVVFNVQWQDRIGRAHRLPLKELPFTVVP